jgi:hypothetical protein
MSNFDDKVFAMAQRERTRYFICGHTHIPMHGKRDGCEYLNPGDWVEGSGVLRKMPNQPWQILLPMRRQAQEVAAKIHTHSRQRPKMPAPVLNLSFQEVRVFLARQIIRAA